MERLWIIINFAGPLLLLALIVWVTLRNRRTSRGEMARTEQATRELREELNREDTGG